MAILFVDNTPFYFSSPEIEQSVRNTAKAHLLARHQPGTYTSAKDISTILRNLLSFYEAEVDILLGPLLSKELLEMILYQYDQVTKVYQRFIANQLNPTDAGAYKTLLAPSYGRVIKFIAERICILENLDAEDYSQQQFDERMERLFACATAVVEISMHCDSTYYIVPDASSLEVFPQQDDRIYNLSVTDSRLLACLNGVGERSRWEVRHGSAMVPSYGSLLSTELYADEHGQILDPIFQNEFGFSYQDAMSILGGVFDVYIAPNNWFPTIFVEKNAVLNNYNLQSALVEKIFDSFTISAQNVRAEGRSFWNPKFQHRLFRRGILQVKQNGLDYLCWGKSLYQEAFMALVKGITYQYLPAEWANDNVRTGLSDLSLRFGAWFEELVQTEFNRLNIRSVRSRKGLGHGPKRIEFAPGEIDLLAYIPEERILVIGECKRVEEGNDPRLYRDAKTTFVTDKKSYAVKLRKKFQFVKENLKAVCSALSTNQELGIPVEPKWLSAVMITRYPTIATCFIPDFRCLSLAELLHDYHSLRAWPCPVEYLLDRHRVQQRAFGHWGSDGYNHGNDQFHWYKAEDEEVQSILG